MEWTRKWNDIVIYEIICFWVTHWWFSRYQDIFWKYQHFYKMERNPFEILKMVCYVTSSFSVIENDDIDNAIVILSLLFLEKSEEGPSFKCLPQVNVSSCQKASKETNKPKIN